MSADCWRALCCLRAAEGPWVVRVGRILPDWYEYLTAEEITYLSAGTRMLDGDRLRITEAGRYLIERLAS